MNWKVNSEKIAKRNNINTFDKLSYAQAKKIGFLYCVPYTNEEAMKEFRKGQRQELEYKLNKWKGES
tara:strand:+ start:1464 stop:1664 length:201 start_codon:yes stop_codon:yes gene_type:complete